MKTLVLEFSENGSEYAGSFWFPVFVDDNAGVVVGSYVGSVGPSDFRRNPNDYGLLNGLLFDRAIRERLLDGDNDDIAH